MREQRRWRRRGWLEAIIVYGTYQAYERLRALVAPGSAAVGLRHARQVVHAERVLGLYHELGVQRAFLPSHPLIQMWDVYYGTVHFIVPALVFFLLWRRDHRRYLRYRNAFGGMLVLALIGFAAYPLTPPRLLPTAYGFVDTAARIGGMGIFDEGRFRDTGNQLAAMPSLHIGWSTWCAVALAPALRRWGSRAAVVIYPVVTLAAVVITANHYLLDGAGGLVVLIGGVALASMIERIHPPTGAEGPDSASEPGPE